MLSFRLFKGVIATRVLLLQHALYLMLAVLQFIEHYTVLCVVSFASCRAHIYLLNRLLFFILLFITFSIFVCLLNLLLLVCQ